MAEDMPFTVPVWFPEGAASFRAIPHRVPEGTPTQPHGRSGNLENYLKMIRNGCYFTGELI